MPVVGAGLVAAAGGTFCGGGASWVGPDAFGSAMAGADVAIGLYERWVAKRLGVCDVPPSGGGQG